MGLKPHLVKYLWTACIRPVILYGSHLWAGNITKTNADKLKRLNRLALLGFSHVHKGTPTASLEIIYDVPPIHLVALELGFSATDRILKASRVSWSGIGTRKKGHLLALQEKKPDLPPGASDLDNTFTHSWDVKALISQLPAKPTLKHAPKSTLMALKWRAEQDVASV